MARGRRIFLFLRDVEEAAPAGLEATGAGATITVLANAGTAAKQSPKTAGGATATITVLAGAGSAAKAIAAAGATATITVSAGAGSATSAPLVAGGATALITVLAGAGSADVDASGVPLSEQSPNTQVRREVSFRLGRLRNDRFARR